MAARPKVCGRPRRTGRERGLAALAAAAVALAPFTAYRAEAETIILKDGTRIPCRILLEGEEEVVVRTAGGMEVSYRKKDISLIERGVSPVEIYEGVAERISERNLAAALYLGHWCLENGLAKEAGSFFDAASRDRSVAGRAYLASVQLVGSAAEKRALLVKAVVADPTLEEAVDALGKSPGRQTRFPADLLAAGSELGAALDLGDARRILQQLSAVERYPDREARAAYAERFREFTGLAFADIRERCGKQRGGPSRDTDDEGRCTACGGTGYIQCPVCLGKGFRLCRTCQGKGRTRTQTHSSRHGIRMTSATCAGCKGTGGQDCGACIRRPDGPTAIVKRFATDVPCQACDGTGRTQGTSTVTPSRRAVVSSEACALCRGLGRVTQRHEASLTIMSSGKRRCGRCNAEGEIPFTAARTPRQDDGRRPAAFSGTSILEPQEQARLKTLADVFQLAAGEAGLRWQAGPKVPFSFAAPGEPARGAAQVFAFGQWCTPSMRDLKAKTAKSLGHKPRAVDTSDFDKWMREQELSYLRSHSRPLSAPRADGAPAGQGAPLRGGPAPGEPRAEDIRALVAALECARRAGVAGSLEQSTILRTTFLPGSAKGATERVGAANDEPPTILRLETSERGATLVLLRDAVSWPATEVRLDPAPPEESGLDLAPAAKAARSGDQGLTVYYRIRSLSREMVGRGPEAATRVLLSAEVLAATLGPEEKPAKTWMREVAGP